MGFRDKPLNLGSTYLQCSQAIDACNYRVLNASEKLQAYTTGAKNPSPNPMYVKEGIIDELARFVMPLGLQKDDLSDIELALNNFRHVSELEPLCNSRPPQDAVTL